LFATINQALDPSTVMDNDLFPWSWLTNPHLQNDSYKEPAGRFNQEICHSLASGPQHMEYKIRFMSSQAFVKFPATLFNRKNYDSIM